MSTPSHYAMMLVQLRSTEVGELDRLDHRHGGESTPLNLGDRVSLDTIEGPYHGTVLAEWVPGEHVLVQIDGFGTVNLHRSVFRAWTALDHLAEV